MPIQLTLNKTKMILMNTLKAVSVLHFFVELQ